MQPNDPPQQHDAQLRETLREWQAPSTPRSLDQRVLGPAQPWWRFLLSGYIRVPVPVACCMTAIMIFAAWRTVKPPTSAPCSLAAQPSACTSAMPGAC